MSLQTDRMAIAGDQYRWPTVIPYAFVDSLEMNAKGIILRALERYRLKTCIDFTPWRGGKNLILFYQGKGCSSLVGKRHGMQKVSIGLGCDKVGIVQHELLHALGFWHEHSHPDRDDYIIIMEERIQSGKEHNFRSRGDKESISLNVPYDYTSVMHYPKYAFPIGLEPTIITKIPNFMDTIGQRIDFSNYDIEKLSKLYNCSSSITFMDSCDFELENICGMIQSSEDNGDWQRVSQVPGGPDTDQSYLGKCRGCGFFMHFNSSSVNVGEKAILESRIYYPKRGFQCLQFYYYNGGNKGDQLKIYVKEYVKVDDKALLKLVNEVKDQPIGSWQLHYVSLTVSAKFRVVFEATRGIGTSAGGLSIDDLNLSETHCPHHLWKISNFTQFISSRGTIYSPPFYSPVGYAYQLYLDVTNQEYIGIYFSLISGANDENLNWPCVWQQATLTLLDQNPDIRNSMSNERSLTTSALKTFGEGRETYYWDKPSKVGVNATFPNGTSYSRGPGYGSSTYITHKWIQSRDFIKGDTVYILVTMEDISRLRFTDSLFFPTMGPVHPTKPHTNLCTNFTCENDGICVIRNDKEECRCRSGEVWWYMGKNCEITASIWDAIMIEVLSTTTVFVVMLIMACVSVYFVKKKYTI
ncbi:meprin A subunit beta-like [Trichosurus vulpecula]|uniref:meprin A subunit beta-like n=1 Tax=Trichosurus vulpecula TaxID=9337 RepID=UPI00186B3F2A|nr:meprin A subunit beta-like [Trichosurus vulpecula]